MGVIKHGMSATPTYRVWSDMKKRCSLPTNADYARYGGRGITVCERWMTFENFLADMGRRPGNTTLDRIDNDGNYEPSNCRWATTAEQNRNQSNTRRLSFRGETLCVREWERKLGMAYGTLFRRLRRGLSVDDAITKPLKRHAQ